MLLVSYDSNFSSLPVLPILSDIVICFNFTPDGFIFMVCRGCIISKKRFALCPDYIVVRITSIPIFKWSIFPFLFHAGVWPACVRRHHMMRNFCSITFVRMIVFLYSCITSPSYMVNKKEHLIGYIEIRPNCVGAIYIYYCPYFALCSFLNVPYIIIFLNLYVRLCHIK